MARIRSAALVLTVALLPLTAAADDWPQWLGPQRDGVWRETGILKEFPPSGPKVRWRAPLGGGYGGPAVAGGKVFVMDRQLAAGTKNPDDPFKRGRIPGTERVLCLKESDGAPLWKHEYDAAYTISYPSGPRCTPTVHQGKVYTLGAVGDLYCLDADTGKPLWHKNFPQDYHYPPAIWGWASHPLVVGDKVICVAGGAGTTAVAFHKDTGAEVWRALTAEQPGYAPPTLITAAGTPQLIIWHPEAVNSLDPETGKVYWSVPFTDPAGKPIKLNAGMSIATPRQAGDLLFCSCFYNGSLMLRLDQDKPGAKVVWRSKSDRETRDKTDTLHAVMATPYLKDGYIYGVCSYGDLRCLKADTGERVWATLKATTAKERPVRWGTAFLVAHEDRFFLFNELGDLIIAKLTPAGYEEISRAHLLEPTSVTAGRDYVWSHPAFANRSAYARNDKEIVCVSLAAEGS
jgi:outer membrane protein assembly factor BamB